MQTIALHLVSVDFVHGLENRLQARAIGDPSTLLYPSELADGGNVTWSSALADANGNVQLTFPTIRFDNLAWSFGNYLFGVQGWALGTTIVLHRIVCCV